MTKLLIVDDSPLMRRLLTTIFEAAGDFEIEVARGGEEAISKLDSWQPDVITLDIQMPGMDGLTCLDRIMLERPCPVVMLSSLTREGAEETLEAMALGAVDFVAKPRGAISLEIEAIAPHLIETVRTAARSRVSRASRLAERIRMRMANALAAPRKRASTSHPRLATDALVVVGTSTGGPPALDALLAPMPADFPCPIVIAQHMPASFTGPLARRLDRLCALDVVEVDRPTPLLPGHAYVARGDADMIVSRRGGMLTALPAPAGDHPWHPSVDRLVASALQQVAPENLIGVLMTGMGTDGAARMAELRTLGGHVIAESAETAVVWGMPGALVAAGGASQILPLEDIARALLARLA
ncbi:two-component system chemotaxis response regulator CheB [Sphingomonas zeicaulis]|uniref:chemotaxis-specific protein-glutamate methyltransferase CheB n=1 Tax=Sphingomonas zeicaulis TaxID=1632740 RepID=UPI003D1A2FEE